MLTSSSIFEDVATVSYLPTTSNPRTDKTEPKCARAIAEIDYDTSVRPKTERPVSPNAPK